ncbi:MAG: dCMP deaminase family protein [Candidatus Micrarchaeota archaeon]|nr:dCMP deaminase family protein [Candidatus Micrarchaeota archaeon]
MTAKRTDYISWDEYFMGIALLSAQRSKDPNTQVGACIVKDKKIVGIGYNGFPMGCSDDELPWEREAENINDTKYPYVVHAEANAIMNSTKDLHGATLYVALFPCNECAKLIIQAGIREIVFLSDKYAETDAVKASKRMLKMAGVKWRQLETKLEKICLNFGKEL